MVFSFWFHLKLWGSECWWLSSEQNGVGVGGKTRVDIEGKHVILGSFAGSQFWFCSKWIGRSQGINIPKEELTLSLIGYFFSSAKILGFHEVPFYLNVRAMLWGHDPTQWKVWMNWSSCWNLKMIKAGKTSVVVIFHFLLNNTKSKRGRNNLRKKFRSFQILS